MKKQKLAVILTILVFVFMSAAASYSAEIAGEVLAVKNKAYLIRDNAKNDAVKQMDLFMKDAVETDKDSRTKLFFKDDSILNLGERSRVEVAEYMYNADQNRSQSVYRLIDGSLRVVVGRSDLEVHTATAVAAARGTKFVIWNEESMTAADNTVREEHNLLASRDVPSGIYLAAGDEKAAKKKTSSTCITVIDGKVEFRNINPDVKGKLMVEEGNTACVPVNDPPVIAADKGTPELYVLGPQEGGEIMPAFAPPPITIRTPDIPDIHEKHQEPPEVAPVFAPVVEPEIPADKQGDFNWLNSPAPIPQ